MNKNSGGPAFPAGVVRKSRPIHDPGAGFVVTDIAEPRHEGMFLRDFFAAKAMQSVISQKDIHDGREWNNCAWISYQIADAMLAEREKGTPK